MNSKNLIKKIKETIFFYLKKLKLATTIVLKDGTKRNNIDPKLVLSLTSYPPRIKTIHRCIRTLLKQTYKPDSLILWLAESQFPDKEDELPRKLIKLKKYGLEICWCDDIKSYKKLVPTLNKYPNAIVITFDDDVYYPLDTVEKLYSEYRKNPNCIHCFRGSKIMVIENSLERCSIYDSPYQEPSYLHQLTGVGGVLYPPHSLLDEVLNKKKFMDIASSNDDLWFWAMAVLNKTRTNIISKEPIPLYFIGNSQKVGLFLINNYDKKLYYKQLQQIIDNYPSFLEIIKTEWSNHYSG